MIIVGDVLEGVKSPTGMQESFCGRTVMESTDIRKILFRLYENEKCILFICY